MFTSRQQSDVTAHPLLLFALATLLGACAAAAWGADAGTANAPRLLPSVIAARVMPKDAETEESLAIVLWQVVQEHSSGDVQAATVTWQRMELPGESEVWRQLGLGVAHLHQGQLEEAAQRLALARKIDPENAAVHYFLGLTGMEQSNSIPGSGGAFTRGDRAVRITRTHTQRHRYQVQAIESFELAVRHAESLNRYRPLVPVHWVVPAVHSSAVPTAPPTVGDLLDAWGADGFVGKSHGLAAHLYLDTGQPENAEQHVDAAYLVEMPIPYGYRLVGDLFEQQGRSTDAFRAYVKAMKHGDGLALPGGKAVDNLHKSFQDLF